MGEYYLWESIRKNKGDAVIRNVGQLLPYFDDILAGNKLNNFPDNVTLYLSETGKLTDDLPVGGGNAFLFSEKLLKILINNGVDSIDYYPCSIKDSAKSYDSHSYYLIVIRDVIHCLDKDNSDLYFAHDDIGGEISNLLSVCVNETILDINNDIFFRLGEGRKNVIIHERIKKLVEAEGMTGMIFTSADGTYPIIDLFRQVNGWLYEKKEFDYSYMLKNDGAECLNKNFPVRKYAFVRKDEEE